MKTKTERKYTFAAPPDWLTARGDYSPWSEGQRKAWQHVEGFYSESAPRVYDQAASRSLSEKDLLALKLFACWLYHWETAGTDSDGDSVARSLAAGRGFKRGGNLGGNPLFDLVHASALCAQQNRAAEQFNSSYADYLKALAAKLDRRNQFDDDLPEWWTPFYMYLTGLASENARPALDSFHGYSGLKNWLRIALGLFLRRFSQKEGGREVNFSELDSETGPSGEDEKEQNFADQIEACESSAATPEEWKIIVERLSEALRQARAQLTDEEWTRLSYYFGEKLQNQQIARLYGEDGSTTSRHRQAALTRFRAALVAALAADPVLRELGDEIFTTWSREFGDFMDKFFQIKE